MRSSQVAWKLERSTEVKLYKMKLKGNPRSLQFRWVLLQSSKILEFQNGGAGPGPAAWLHHCACVVCPRGPKTVPAASSKQPRARDCVLSRRLSAACKALREPLSHPPPRGWCLKIRGRVGRKTNICLLPARVMSVAPSSPAKSPIISIFTCHAPFRINQHAATVGSSSQVNTGRAQGQGKGYLWRQAWKDRGKGMGEGLDDGPWGGGLKWRQETCGGRRRLQVTGMRSRRVEGQDGGALPGIGER